MTRTLFGVASLALVTAMPSIPAALAKGTPKGAPPGSVQWENGSLVTICYAATRSDCAHAVGAYIREHGIDAIFAPNCERLLDGRWIFMVQS